MVYYKAKKKEENNYEKGRVNNRRCYQRVHYYCVESPGVKNSQANPCSQAVNLPWTCPFMNPLCYSISTTLFQLF